MVGSLRVSGAVDVGGQQRSKPGGSEREMRYVVCWCRSSSQGNGMRLSHAGRYASYGSWRATSALAKGKYRLSSSGGIPHARRKTFSIVSVGARAQREYGMRLKRSNYVFVTFGVFEVWKSERACLSRGGPAEVAWASKGVRICVPIDAHAWT